jgi:hypothetical protein
LWVSSFLYARKIKRFQADDVFMVVAIAFALATTVSMMVELRLISKSTRHLYTLMSLQSALAFSIVYWPAVWGIKMSVLGFYSRGLETLRLKILMWSLMGLVSAHSLAAVFVSESPSRQRLDGKADWSWQSSLLVCTPVAAAWTPILFGHDCRRSSQVQMVHAAINVCFNALVPLACIVVYLRPRPEGRKNKGFRFGLMTSLASLVVVASIGRTAAFNDATYSQHPAL